MTDKAVLISINPHPTEQIVIGIKTDEVRLTKPSLSPPFKCYIYETSGNKFKDNSFRSSRVKGSGRKKVIGEFVCDKITTHYADTRNNITCYWTMGKGCCLTPDELMNYGKGKPLYSWHITNLVIYENPKSLSEFRSYNVGVVWEDGYPMPTHEISRPPQSWCYVEAKR